MLALGQQSHDVVGYGLHVILSQLAIAVGITGEERDGDISTETNVKSIGKAAIARVAQEQRLETVGILVYPSGAGRLVDGCVGQEVTAASEVKRTHEPSASRQYIFFLSASLALMLLKLPSH